MPNTMSEALRGALDTILLRNREPQIRGNRPISPKLTQGRLAIYQSNLEANLKRGDEKAKNQLELLEEYRNQAVK